MPLANFGNSQQQRCQADDHQHGTQVIDDRLALRHRQADEGSICDDQRGCSQRQIDQEHPAPGQVFSHQAAEHRPGNAGHGIHAAEVTLIAAAFARWHDVGDDRLADRNHPARANALKNPRQHQLFHALRQATEQRSQGEKPQSEQHQFASPVKIAEFAVDRHGHGQRDHVGGYDPGQQIDVSELGGNGRHRDRDDGLVQRAEQDCHHQRKQDAADGRRRLIKTGQGKT